MKRRRLGRLLVTSALTALGWLPLVHVLGPVLGARASFALFVAGASALHLAVLAPSLGRGVRVGLAAGAVVLPLSLLAPSIPACAVVAAGSLAVARSAVLFPARPARALVRETLLVGGGLLAAGIIATPTTTGIALGAWTFLLVQSTFVLGGGVEPRTRATSDAFEAARVRIERELAGPRP